MSNLVEKIGKQFRTFGGGQDGFNNPIAAALKDGPLQFAAGVDVAEVVAFIQSESGYDWAIKRAQDLAKDVVSLRSACKAILPFKECEDRCCSDGGYVDTYQSDEFEAAFKLIEDALKITQSTPSPARPPSQPEQRG